MLYRWVLRQDWKTATEVPIKVCLAVFANKLKYH